MATTINSNTTDGIVITPDTSGEIELQADGVTKAKITANGLQDNNGNSLRGGSFRNLLINGDFGIWQRGTSFTSSGLTADRWKYESSGATGTVSRQEFAIGQTDVPNNPKYFLRYAISTGNDNARIGQCIEGVDTASGQTITVSYWAKLYSGTLPDMAPIRIRQVFGTGGTPSTEVYTSTTDTLSLTSSWQKITTTITVPSISGKTLGTNNNDYVKVDLLWQNDTSTGAYTIDIANVQVEVGEGASDFEHLPYDVQLQRCLRYCIVYGGDNVYDTNLWGSTYSTTAGLVHAIFPTAMRTTPSVSYSSLSDWSAHLPAIVALTVTGIFPASDSSKYSVGLTVTHASNGSMGGNKAYNIRANNTTNARLTFSAEL